MTVVYGGGAQVPAAMDVKALRSLVVLTRVRDNFVAADLCVPRRAFRMRCCFGRQPERGQDVLDRYLPAEPVAPGTPTATAFAARHSAAGNRDGCREWQAGYAR